MILHIPVRKKEVKIQSGETRFVHELANGFVSVTTDEVNVGWGPGGRILISNPFTEVFMDFFNRGMIGANERIAIDFEELPQSQDGQTDDLLSHLDQVV